MTQTTMCLAHTTYLGSILYYLHSMDKKVQALRLPNITHKEVLEPKIQHRCMVLKPLLLGAYVK